ncbi:hypothetical protein AB1Y20_002116 [Prymnesium parvum]|uniref:Nucleotide-diphospho-sugar transferase domain-containing protein n=1 Tax=Prymnesium parvum TaxID=97485 RepID=A0AB34JAR5_PRYPA
MPPARTRATRLALLLLLTRAGASADDASPSGRALAPAQKRLRRAARRSSPSDEISYGLPPDLGARWRIRLVESGRYFYRHEASVIASAAFFSLFELRATGDGSHMIADHAGNWLHAPRLPASHAQLALLPSAPPAPPGVDAAVGALPPDELQRWWLHEHPSGAYALSLEQAGGRVLCQDGANPLSVVTSVVGAPRATWWGSAASGGEVNASCLFELQRVIAPTEERAREKETPAVDRAVAFKRRVQQSITRVAGRDFVLVTYHNIGMIDWATLFWGWLDRSGVKRFMLLELDGLTCDASRALNASIAFECVNGYDLMLPKAYTAIKKASALQDWGTDSDSGYFKFLRWKLRIVELICLNGADVLMADVDVLVLSPRFFHRLARSEYDLTISSDARHGIYNDNRMCPCSHPMYQKYAADWVCAGLFYLRSTPASLWFIREVQVLMDEFIITDQDAIQAVLTGHTQVAIPMMRLNKSAAAGGGERYRPSSAWLKPMWIEGLARGSNLRNMRGIQPLNTPMKEAMWNSYQKMMGERRFTWSIAPYKTFGNGPQLVDHWETLFSRGMNETTHSFLSIHANCNTKAWLAADVKAASFLLHPAKQWQRNER